MIGKIMRNSVVAIFLAALAGNACAGWTAIYKNDDATIYADMDAIRRSNNIVKMWMLTDYARIQSLSSGVSYLSVVALSEFDCAEQRLRTLQTSAFQGKMREGANVYTAANTPWPWTYVEPGTINQVYLKVACKK
jgi:hypothetical protein